MYMYVYIDMYISKAYPRTGHENPEGEYSFIKLGARWGGCSTPRPGRFTRGKESWYPLYRRLCEPQGAENLPPTGI